jgi:N-acetylglucosaminyldiphosphoundecaprenol N-acetyl-beta-D-mannosaminyltransferase
MDFNKISLFNYAVARVTMDELIDKIDEFIVSGKPHKLVLLNPYIVLEAKKHHDYGDYIRNCDIITADGVGLLMAAKLFGKPFPQRVTGTDFMPAIARLASEKGYSMYLLGAAPGIAQKAAEKLVKQFPGLKIAGVQHGYFTAEEEKTVIEGIKKAKPDILVVCMGVYIQEMFIEKYYKELGIPLSFGNGAALDFVSERVKRAPLWMQKRGLEWFFRFMQEPGRMWKRYLIGNVVFLWLTLKEYLNRGIKAIIC